VLHQQEVKQRHWSPGNTAIIAQFSSQLSFLPIGSEGVSNEGTSFQSRGRKLLYCDLKALTVVVL